jgi:hypothetical protein
MRKKSRVCKRVIDHFMNTKSGRNKVRIVSDNMFKHDIQFYFENNDLTPEMNNIFVYVTSDDHDRVTTNQKEHLRTLLS